jgi:hypothetical protein
MQRPDHAAEIRNRLIYPRPLIEALGLGDGAKRQPGDGVTIRCPVHNERTPSCSVTLGPDGTVRVRCFACEFSGDALTLVAAAYQLDTTRDFLRVLQAAAQLAGYDLDAPDRAAPPPKRREIPPPQRPDANDLAALWTACGSVADLREHQHDEDSRVIRFLADRGIHAGELGVLDIARVTPQPHDYDWPAWWPQAWARSWRIVTLAYEADGIAVSLHARAIDGSTPKTRWPLRCASSGLLFANKIGHKMLCGIREPQRILVTEGMTDFLSASVMVANEGREHAVIGITSGSAQALSKVAWPPRVGVAIITHEDRAGETYATQVRAALPPGTRAVRFRAEWVDVDRNETAQDLH